MASLANAAVGRLEARGEGRFALTGCAGFSTARGLLEEGTRLFAGKGALEVDLAAVTSVDSAGLALLLCWLADARRDGRRLSFSNLPAQLRAIARISDLEALLDDSAAVPG